MRVLRALGLRYSRLPLPAWTFGTQLYTNWHGEKYITGEPKPVLRGVLHLVCAFTLMPIEAVVVALTVAGRSPQAHVAALLPLATVWLLLLTSGLYHRVRWTTERQHNLALRCDHANIFLSGAASLVAQALVMYDAPDGETQYAGAALMALACTLASLGISYSFFAPLDSNVVGRIRWLRAMLYLSLGGCVLLFFGPLWPLLTMAERVHQIVNIAVGFLSMLFFVFRPLDAWPDVFGTHEVFHVVVVLATSSSVWLAASIAQHI